MRRTVAGHKDATHDDVVQAFASYGVTVLSMAGIGGGAPDLLCGDSGRNFLVEVKGGRKPSERIASGAQESWANQWSGSRPFLILNVDDVTRLMTGELSALVGTTVRSRLWGVTGVNTLKRPARGFSKPRKRGGKKPGS
jgi:hypothetical protein